MVFNINVIVFFNFFVFNIIYQDHILFYVSLKFMLFTVNAVMTLC